MLNKISSELSDKLKKLKSNKKFVVFLGGECQDNTWREDIKKKYGKQLLILDPYDKDWSPESSIYDEVKGMLASGIVLFYKGGKQTKLEKNFLKGIYDPGRIIECDSLAEVTKFFKDLTRHDPIADRLRKLAHALEKIAYPVVTVNGVDVDLYFEYLDQDAKNNVIKDLIDVEKLVDENGHSIINNPYEIDPKYIKNIKVILPDFSIPGTRMNHPKVGYITGVDLPKSNLQMLLKLFSNKSSKHTNVLMDYDPVLHKYYQIEPEPVSHGYPEIQYDIHGKPPVIHEPTYALKTAKTGVAYSKGCAMISAPEQVARSVIAYGKVNVPDKDLYTEKEDQGREDDIHITLFYGFTEDNTEKIAAILRSIKPFTVRLGLVNAFKDQKDYDVLKITAESPEIEKLHYLLEKELKNDNKYPTYAPHLTVAYLKKGKADKLIGDDKFRGTEFLVDHIIYSDKNNKRTSIQFG